MAIYGLVDCNNFYASCEKIFRPDLANTPIVVLSNNDGCVVARSSEVKKLGIPAGIPYFKVKHQLESIGVKIFSSNYTFYGDISNRVMSVLREYTGEIEIYSIDEAFIDLTTTPKPENLGKLLHSKISQGVGVPVSIGIASSKTLAKVATDVAKKNPQYGGVYSMLDKNSVNNILKDFPVSKIWGVGPQTTKFLNNHSIFTALEFINCEDDWIRKNLKILGLKTVWELRGRDCITMETSPKNKKSILSSRSFGQPVTSQKQLQQAISSYIAIACKKLRSQKSVANYLHVFVRTNKHKKHELQQHSSQLIRLQTASNYTPDLTKASQEAVAKLFQPGYKYKKAGVVLTGLHPENQVQENLFIPSEKTPKQNKAIAVLDRMNNRFGRNKITLASSGIKPKWIMRCELRSNQYTTNWQEIPNIKI